MKLYYPQRRKHCPSSPRFPVCLCQTNDSATFKSRRNGRVGEPGLVVGYAAREKKALQFVIDLDSMSVNGTEMRSIVRRVHWDGRHSCGFSDSRRNLNSLRGRGVEHSGTVVERMEFARPTQRRYGLPLLIRQTPALVLGGPIIISDVFVESIHAC